jgi:hypothetical protein
MIKDNKSEGQRLSLKLSCWGTKRIFKYSFAAEHRALTIYEETDSRTEYPHKH